MILVGIQDLILAPILFLAIWQLGRIYAKKKYGKTEYASYFSNSLLLRLLGGVGIALIYVSVYKGGDTTAYFTHAKRFTAIIFEDPLSNWIILFPEFFHDKIVNIPSFPVTILRSSNLYLVVRITTFFNLFLFDSFVAVTMIFAVWGFLGSWKLFKLFAHYKPSNTPQIAVFCLYMPSLLLWGSGIFKDTISFGGLGILTYCIYNLLIRHRYKLRYVLLSLLCTYLVGTAKPYILLALFPSLIFFILNQYGSRIQSSFLRTAFFPLILTVVIALSFVVLNLLSTTFTAYSLDNIDKKAEAFQQWHTVLAEQHHSSGYTIPEGNIVVKVLASLNVTYFRPYLWESRKPIVFLAALESLYVLLFTLHTIRKVGINVLVKSLITDPMISFCFIFSLTFGFAIGSTAYNFGALSRFKIPCLPFYMVALSLTRTKKNEATTDELRKIQLIKNHAIRS